MTVVAKKANIGLRTELLPILRQALDGTGVNEFEKAHGRLL